MACGPSDQGCEECLKVHAERSGQKTVSGVRFPPIADAQTPVHYSGMTTVRVYLAPFVAFVLLSCGQQQTCETLTSAKAEAMAVREKAGKLSKSTPGYAANFESDEVVDVRTNIEGHAAKVGFKGRDGWTLVALVGDDCAVAWTMVPPRPTP